jgi:hypothetical protein
MEDQIIFIDAGEVITTPPTPTTEPIPAHVDNGARHEDQAKVTQPGVKDQTEDEHDKVLQALLGKELRHMFPRNRAGLRAYGAALAGGFTLLPVFALSLTIAFYLIFSSAENWVPITLGMVVTCLLWLLLAWPLSFLTSRDKVNTRSYGLLVSRLSQLETRLLAIEATKPKLSLYQIIALEEAYTNFQELDAMLYDSTARLPWVLGLGYVVAWFKLHRAEEALLEVEPVEIVVRGAYHDYLAISKSNMTNAKELVDRLHAAVKTLDPGMAGSVSSSNQLGDVVDELHEIEGKVGKIAQSLHIEADTHNNNKKKDDEQGTEAHKSTGISSKPDDEANARLTIREIRRILNEYRDLLWGNLIRGRNRLMGGIFIAGLATYVLLCTTLLSLPPAGGTLVERSAILAAAAYYIVGAIAGLFGIIYRESTANTSTSTDADDYGLTLARLIGTPLLSGLAGVGGALLYSAVVIQVANSKPLTLLDIFALGRVDYLLAAALFGYAPSLIVQGLQQRTNKYLSDLQSSKASDGNGSDSSK